MIIFKTLLVKDNIWYLVYELDGVSSTLTFETFEQAKDKTLELGFNLNFERPTL